eukprot:TRINITY_DN1111_c1_g1_i3.p1 TRINITY_DN1111_c1_g1~~TRINITY_DN1111_c1_g1_i3.p1  ORF type:complete len:108 (+),score=1.11 TRINITY_DN1111_c1_g1_i3:653-976(+)
MKPESRDYFQSFEPSALSAYERYIHPGTAPVAQNLPSLPTPRYADSPTVAPELQKVLEARGFDGWMIPDGYFWKRPSGDVEFHRPEVMLLDPEKFLHFQQGFTWLAQ